MKSFWNKQKSKKLLLEYGENASDSDTDKDTEQSVKSRNRRLKVAQAIGIGQAQLNFGILSLWFGPNLRVI
jgi:hypothetical protein